MPSYYRSKKKNARAMIEKRIALIAAVAVLLVVMIVLLSRCYRRGKDVTTANSPVPTPAPSAVAAISALTPEPTLAPTPDACPDAACRHSICVYRVDGSRSRGARDYPSGCGRGLASDLQKGGNGRENCRDYG